MYPGRSDGVMQFYPDHDPDLINTNQLDGMPYVLQGSTINLGAAAVPKVVVNAAYNASSSADQKKLSYSQRWELGLLEMAHSNPETLCNYSGIPPGKRGGFKFFGELRGEEDRGQGGMGSSGGTFPGPNFGGWNGGEREICRTPASAPPSTVGYRRGEPAQPLSSGGGGGQRLGGSGRGRVNTLTSIHETPRMLCGGHGSAASSKAAARGQLCHDVATKVEQMRNKAELKREEYMKEIRSKEKAAAKKAKLEEEAAEAERIKEKKLERDRRARDRKVKDWIEKSKDVRTLAAKASACRDAATKDPQHERPESLKEKRAR